MENHLTNFLIQLILWLKRALEEETGKPSFKRLAGIALFVVFAVAYMKIAIPSQQLLDIPSNWMILLGSIILGLGFIEKYKGKQ